MSLKNFYDSYHKQNNNYSKIISENNFTYFYILEFLQEHFMMDFANKKILDVGCGVGTMSLLLASLGGKVEGIDISERAINIAKNAKKNVKLKDVVFLRQELKKGKGNFDLVISTEVIEHIENDKDFLNKIKSNLRKNGLLVLTTPSKENFFYKMGFYQNFDEKVGHLRRYTRKGLTKLIEKQGFVVIDVKERESILRNILFTTKLGIIIKLIRGPLIPLFHVFDRFLIKVFGPTDIMVLAKKR